MVRLPRRVVEELEAEAVVFSVAEAENRAIRRATRPEAAEAAVLPVLIHRLQPHLLQQAREVRHRRRPIRTM